VSIRRGKLAANVFFENTSRGAGGSCISLRRRELVQFRRKTGPENLTFLANQGKPNENPKRREKKTRKKRHKKLGMGTRQMLAAIVAWRDY